MRSGRRAERASGAVGCGGALGRRAVGSGPARSASKRGQRPAQLAPLIDTPATLCFVCGPESMVAAVPKMLLDLGVEKSRIRIEEW